ncbi:Uncharacterised protein [Amycolatopsis camponoti]|uniref:Uncharacterized protein n=1 Tax=Amycolatopsis camponoti TaxID=2606593 RepID=A0A6I8LHV6_9PSEU|nr:Uncharacterised protein [Amycolatopsis camponoti]
MLKQIDAIRRREVASYEQAARGWYPHGRHACPAGRHACLDSRHA